MKVSQSCAALLCERLGYRLFDKTLMAQVAKEMGLQPESIKAVSLLPV